MKRTFLSFIVVTAFMLGTIHLSGCGAGGADKEAQSKESYFEEGDYNSGKDEKGKQESEMTASDAPSGADQSMSKTSNVTASSELSGDDDGSSTLKTPKKTIEEKVVSKIIKTAEISMQVRDYEKDRKQILAMINGSGAYISGENQANTSYSKNDDVEIRIKPSGFDSLVEKILEIALYVDYSKITADDVSEEYVDAEARLKSKEEVETQYKEILKKASSISEIMSVQEKINKIREEIDAYKAKLKFMDDKVNYSTIKLHFYEKQDDIAAPETGFSYRIGKAFRSGWNGLQVFFIGIIYLWPLWLISLTALYIVFWLIKRRRKKRAIQKTQA